MTHAAAAATQRSRADDGTNGTSIRVSRSTASLRLRHADTRHVGAPSSRLVRMGASSLPTTGVATAAGERAARMKTVRCGSWVKVGGRLSSERPACRRNRKPSSSLSPQSEGSAGTAGGAHAVWAFAAIDRKEAATGDRVHRRSRSSLMLRLVEQFTDPGDPCSTRSAAPRHHRRCVSAPRSSLHRHRA